MRTHLSTGTASLAIIGLAGLALCGLSIFWPIGRTATVQCFGPGNSVMETDQHFLGISRGVFVDGWSEMGWMDWQSRSVATRIERTVEWGTVDLDWEPNLHSRWNLLGYDYKGAGGAGKFFLGGQRNFPAWEVFLLFLLPYCAQFSRRLLPRPTRPAGACASCGYNLTGNTSGICPECGAPTSQASSPSQHLTHPVLAVFSAISATLR